MLHYPPAADFPVSWSSHRDNAGVAAALFSRTDVTGTIAVGQHPGITGPTWPGPSPPAAAET